MLSSSSIPVNLIRQWCYCPRVVYYMELANVKFYRPRWVEQGSSFHEQEKILWSRRNLSRFQLQEGKKHHKLAIQNKDMGLHGIIDMAIETDTEVYAVEFKLSLKKKKKGDQLQLVAYAMLLEKYFSKPSSVGFLIDSSKELQIISIDKSNRQSVIDISKRIKDMLGRGAKPQSSASVAQCCNCEYVNFCNDRL